jgi:transposase InsO family protein
MSMARLVVTAVRVEGRSISAVARDYSVSRRWIHELLRRYDTEGEAGLQPRSRRPHASPQRTPDSVQDEIVQLRKTLTDQGLDAGAHTIAYHLTQRHGSAPAPSTIWRILTRRGFVSPQPRKRPRSSWRRFEADQPSERWQADITHWTLADVNSANSASGQSHGVEVEILNLLDDHARLALASHARHIFKAADVLAIVTSAITAYGLPAAVLTDNGAVFAGGPRGGGRVALEVTLTALGVSVRHARPYHPQTCGKVERFHQTLKKWLARHPRATTAEQLQAQLDTFRAYYNAQRPHRALGRRTPAQAYAARPKATPGPGLAGTRTLPAHARLRRDKIDPSGVITLRSGSRLHHIGLGRRHAGTRVLVLALDRHIRVLAEDTGQLLRELTLDPARDYQPQARK